MNTLVNLYSDKKGEIKKFLDIFYDFNDTIIITEENLKWEKEFKNPVEVSEIIGTFIDNNDKYKINMWISFDKNIFINITENNVNKIIKYIFERYPY